MVDPYAILELPFDAPDIDVRSAYRRKALATHPDKGGSHAAFLQVVQAFEILGDVIQRTSHDASREQSGRLNSAKQSCSGTSCKRPRNSYNGSNNMSSKPQQRKADAANPTAPSTARRETEAADEAKPDWLQGGAGLEGLLHSDGAAIQEHLSRLPCNELKELEQQLNRWLLRRPSTTRCQDVQQIQASLTAGQREETSGGCESSSSGEDEDPVLALCDELAENGDGPATPAGTGEKGAAAGNIRGIRQRHTRQGMVYHATLGIESFVIVARGSNDLQEAIDMHIALVRTRQLIRAARHANFDFPDCAMAAFKQVEQERQQSGSPEWKPRFFVRLRCAFYASGALYSPKVADLSLALTHWRDLRRLKERQNDQPDFEQAVQELKARMKEEAAKLKRAGKAGNKGSGDFIHYARTARRLQPAIRASWTARKAACRRSFGLRHLPAGIVLNYLQQPYDSVRSVLEVEQRVLYGPCRMNVEVAVADLTLASDT
eukprot:TRINITY_DN9376_c0_g1_i4.p1 TRINITY_DN9376_c0_g1~~TRINITY_DN9376_c0_g1_i4.p1  ORF type:complete len:490 (-),score=43.80 TRINITY_DN9376_c0_g1_i4:50-1519(-)